MTMTTTSPFPSATYSSPDVPSKTFTVDPSNPRYQTTEGKTTGPSDYVLKAGQIDRDKPSGPRVDPKDADSFTYLSKLRMALTGLQDDINEFLTERMEIAKNKKQRLYSPSKEREIQSEIKDLLDGGDE